MPNHGLLKISPDGGRVHQVVPLEVHVCLQVDGDQAGQLHGREVLLCRVVYRLGHQADEEVPLSDCVVGDDLLFD